MAFEPRRNCENERLKALVIKMPFTKDLGHVIQVARAEGVKLFNNKFKKVQVVDLVRREYGYIAVVQASEVVSGGVKAK